MMPGMNGLETLRALKSAKPDLQAIMLSGREHASTIVEAVRLGAADYVVKPDDPEGLGEIALDSAIKSAIEKTRLASELTELRRQLSDDQDRAFLFWGDSPEMKTIAQVIEQESDSDVTVLIRGESGVGKELVARAIHQRSPRKEPPIAKVNCAALPLRERRAEIAQLTSFFMDRYARRYNRASRELSPELQQLFQSYEWPGNIRELENMIKRIVILQDEQLVVREMTRAARPVAAYASAGVGAGTAVATDEPDDGDIEGADEGEPQPEEPVAMAPVGSRLADVAK